MTSKMYLNGSYTCLLQPYRQGGCYLKTAYSTISRKIKITKNIKTNSENIKGKVYSQNLFATVEEVVKEKSFQ